MLVFVKKGLTVICLNYLNSVIDKLKNPNSSIISKYQSSNLQATLTVTSKHWCFLA